jgi:hypothetical protein
MFQLSANEQPCPECGRPSRVVEPLKAWPGPNQVWLCLWCLQGICNHCYMQHTARVHPELYGLPSEEEKPQ